MIFVSLFVSNITKVTYLLICMEFSGLVENDTREIG